MKTPIPMLWTAFFCVLSSLAFSKGDDIVAYEMTIRSNVVAPIIYF
jgi:hypothetical protein